MGGEGAAPQGQPWPGNAYAAPGSGHSKGVLTLARLRPGGLLDSLPGEAAGGRLAPSLRRLLSWRPSSTLALAESSLARPLSRGQRGRGATGADGGAWSGGYGPLTRWRQRGAARSLPAAGLAEEASRRWSSKASRGLRKR